MSHQSLVISLINFQSSIPQIIYDFMFDDSFYIFEARRGGFTSISALKAEN